MYNPVMFRIAFLFLSIGHVFAQSDTVLVQSKIDEARALFSENPSRSLALAFEANRLAGYSENRRLLAFSLNTVASAYSYTGRNDSAILYHQQALAIQEVIHDELGMGRSLTNMGICYTESGLNDKAIQCFLEAEKKFIRVKFDIGLSKLYNSLGSLFYSINDFNNSISYYKKGIAISEKLDDVVLNYSLKINLANVYGTINKPREALALYTESYTATKAEGNVSDLLMVCNNMCHEYLELKNYAAAEYYSNEALQIIETNPIENYLKTTSFSNHAEILTKKGRFPEAVAFADSALIMLKSLPDLSKEIGLKYQLGRILHKNKNYERSYEVLVDALNLKDTLYAKNLKEKLSEINTIHEVEKKEGQISLLSESQKKQKTINYLLAGVVVVSFAFLIAAIISYRRKQKDNDIIRRQKNDVSAKNLIIEAKQKEILDSINYAKRIQYALLSSEQQLAENLKEYFLMFKPKDVVSGDFYWSSVLSNGRFLLAVADSTGHGVPGSIMSMLNISCLNEAVNADKLLQPADILNATRTKIIRHLSNDGSAEGGKDGMDCCLLSLDFAGRDLSYAAANNPIWIVRRQELLVLAADKMPVGKHDRDSVPFSQHSVALEAGDMIYLFTDGYADQFGGPKGKKFKYRALQELLLSVANMPVDLQKQAVTEAFERWKGSLEQVDDVCLIGIRV